MIPIKNIIFLCLIIFGLYAEAQEVSQPVIVIHGGAGSMRPGTITPEREELYKLKMSEALTVGYEILQSGGSGIDAVIAAIRVMEESPLFNAGIGAVFTNDGKIELDAALMNGADLNAGTVAGVSHIQSPIKAAYAVMTASPHVMMIGAGAERFAEEQGLKMVESSYFETERRKNQYKKIREKDDAQGFDDELKDIRKYGTVGAVALDKHGNLAAGTSTGGISNKMYGRVGDVPIIGAGTYADNRTCAVSATGAGEYFIRLGVARDISAHMEYLDMELQEAAEKVIHEKLPALGGTGGIIALDNKGNISMQFNTDGMFRGSISRDGKMEIKIYKE